VCVPAILGVLAVWRPNTQKKKASTKQHFKFECVSTARTCHDTYEHEWFHLSFVGVPFESSFVGVPFESCQAFLGFLITAHHLCAFLV